MNKAADNASLWTAWSLVALSIAGTWPGSSSLGQDPGWVTVDEFQLEDFPGNRLISIPDVLSVDSRGTVFVGGRCWEGLSTSRHWVVRRSADGGQTWATVDHLFVRDSMYSVHSFAEDASGNLYAAGGFSKKGAGFCNVVRKSQDGGENWVTVDEMQGFSGSAIATDASGTIVFVAGGGGVRRSLDAGVNWEWVDGEPGGRFSGHSVAATDGAVFVAGAQCPPAGCRIGDDATWLLKKTTDGGKVWTPVYESSTDDRGQKLLVDSLGNLYALGALCAMREGEENHQWNLQCIGTRLRRAVQGGTAWEEVFTDHALCVVVDMAFDAWGALYAVGCSKNGDRTGLQEDGVWQTRKSTDGGKSWELIDRFVAPGNQDVNWATAVAVDREGSVYVCGPQRIDFPRQVWFVRKLPGPGAGKPHSFRRGDSDANGAVNITDAVFTLNGLFLGGPQPACPDAADADDNGKLSLTDAVYSLQYLFQSGPRPPDPGPDACGVDSSADGLEGCDYELSRC